MNMRKWLCAAIALVLAISAFALAEGGEDDLQARLDAANTRIEELEALVEKYRPFYEAQVLAEYGEDGIVWKEDAQARYDQIASEYASYGVTPEQLDPNIRQTIVEGLVNRGVVTAKIAELGLDQMDEQTLADLGQKADEDLEMYVEYYGSYFATEGATDEENREAALAGLAGVGVTRENLLQDRIDDYAAERLYDSVTADVSVDEEETRNAYDTMLSEDQERFTDEFEYIQARNQDELVVWNPEGYRAVKHVLIKFNDEQAKRYNNLTADLSGFQAELDALDAPADVDAADAADVADAADAAEAQPPRAREEIQADIDRTNAELDALYEELMPTAEEVVKAFGEGTDIDVLIDQYGEDPGMTSEPYKTEGYAVSAESTYLDPAFTEGAMAIEGIGQISAPVRASNGIHIIYYLKDITPGAVPYEDIHDDVAAMALETKVSKVYNDQVAAWVEEAHPVYHIDRFN